MQSEHIAGLLFLGLLIYVLVELYHSNQNDQFLLVSKIVFLGFIVTGIPYLLFIGGALLSVAYLYETHISMKKGVTDHTRTLVPILIFVLIFFFLPFDEFESPLFWFTLIACVIYGLIIFRRIRITAQKKSRGESDQD